MPVNYPREEEKLPPPVTLPKLAWLDTAPQDDNEEVTARFVEQRIIKSGAEAWATVTKGGSFDTWKRIGAALAIGKAHAIKVTDATWGQNYSRVFGQWMQERGFGRMPKGTRSWALALHENLPAIEQWRQTLPPRDRQRLINPQSVVKRWQRSTQALDKTKYADEALKAAEIAWRRFVSCVEALPPDQAAPFWLAAQGQAAIHL